MIEKNEKSGELMEVKEQAKTVRKHPERMIVRIWLVLALICLLAGLIAQYTFRLKEPLFLHYSQSAYLGCGLDGVETSDVWYTQVNFAYLTDVTDEICVREIRFSELPELQMQEMRETVQSAGQYALHRLDATLSIEDPQHNGIRQWRILTRAQVLYSDGNTADVKIGNLVLIANPEGGSALENPSSSANSDGTATQVYTVQKDGTIEVKGCIASAGEMENFSMTLNGEPIPAQKEGEDPKRLTVKTGDVLTFQSHWIGKEEDQSPQVFHSGVAVLSYIGKDGGEQVLSFENEYRKRRELRFIDVWKYLLKEEAFK
ncbi:hypothetical protein DW970_09660 [Clostridium sp. AM48-13]|jgi:hypothetical protein|uniref:hypothetical protein n=1 Tax=Clostridium TaxID=1485 RepID=UPI000E536685|nr:MULTISPECIES: hypothetical protein [Clostridium]RHQ17757.1 hypothetical protein DW970_09660 [Clostridium sp. AM48-13]RHQ34039.1 hypothetical protein DWY89_06355 [Clostridium sp. AF27-5AA]